MEANLHWSKKTMTDFAEIETVLLHLRKKIGEPKGLDKGEQAMSQTAEAKARRILWPLRRGIVVPFQIGWHVLRQWHDHAAVTVYDGGADSLPISRSDL